MKRNNTIGAALIALSLMALGSSPALARHHWDHHTQGQWQQNAAPVTAGQQRGVQNTQRGVPHHTHCRGYATDAGEGYYQGGYHHRGMGYR